MLSAEAPGVLLVGNYPPPYGGIPSHLEELARHLAERGVRVHVLSPKYKNIADDRPDERVWLHSMEPRSMGAKAREVVRFPGTAAGLIVGRSIPVGDAYRVIHLANEVERLVNQHRLDVVSAYHVLPGGVAGVRGARRSGVPCAVTLFGEVYSDPLLFTRRRRITDHVLRQAAAVWSVSRHCAEGARSHGYEVDVTYYGVSLSRFSGVVSDGAPKWLTALTGPVVGFVGRMEEEMGLGVLIDAVPRVLEEIPDSSFLIAGRQGALTDRAWQAASSHAGRVHVLVDPPNQTVADVYAASTVVAVPSTNGRACLGLAIAEASASQRPVVVSDVGGGPEILGPGAGVLVTPRDSRALADALLDFLRNPHACRVAGQAGRDFIEQNFDMNERNRAIADRILALRAGAR